MPLLLESRTSGLCLIVGMIGALDHPGRLAPMPALCGRGGDRGRGLLGEIGTRRGVDLESDGNAVRRRMATEINGDEWRALHDMVFTWAWVLAFLIKSLHGWIRLYVIYWHLQQDTPLFEVYIRYGISLSRRAHYC